MEAAIVAYRRASAQGASLGFRPRAAPGQARPGERTDRGDACPCLRPQRGRLGAACFVRPVPRPRPRRGGSGAPRRPRRRPWRRGGTAAHEPEAPNHAVGPNRSDAGPSTALWEWGGAGQELPGHLQDVPACGEQRRAWHGAGGGAATTDRSLPARCAPVPNERWPPVGIRSACSGGRRSGSKGAGFGEPARRGPGRHSSLMRIAASAMAGPVRVDAPGERPAAYGQGGAGAR